MRDDPCSVSARRCRSRLLAAALLVELGVGLGAARHDASAGPAADRSPTTDERVGYWIDRIVRGPEPSPLALPNYHQGLLADAQRNLAAVPDDALARLADPALRSRVQSSRDQNPWLGLLGVLVRIGRKNPAVARAWAAPAAESDELLLRREGVGVLATLGDAADGPRFVAAFRRDPGDRTIGPVSLKALLALGPPWDGEAARAALEAGVADLGGTSSVWEGFLPAADERPGGVRDDVAAWWSLIAGFSGPRAVHPHTKGPRVGDDPTDVFPVEHGYTSGAASAAYAHVLLARRGHEAALVALRADAESADPAVREIARRGLPPTAAALAGARDAASTLIRRLEAHDPTVRPDDVVDAVKALHEDPAPEVAALLEALLRATPIAREWRPALFAPFVELRHRGIEPLGLVNEYLRSGDPARVDLALSFVRAARDVAYIDLVEAFLADPGAASFTHGTRRVLVDLYGVAAGSSRIEPSRVAEFVRRLVAWIVDPDDPSARGLSTALLDFGPAGEAEFARGLSGPDRAAYVAALGQTNDRYVSAAVADALLDGLDASSPPAAQQEVLTAAFAVAPPESAAALERAAARLRSPAREEATALLRIVVHRLPPPR